MGWGIAMVAAPGPYPLECDYGCLIGGPFQSMLGFSEEMIDYDRAFFILAMDSFFRYCLVMFQVNGAILAPGPWIRSTKEK